MKLLNAILNWTTTINKAKAIKADPEKQPKSKRFGIFAMIYGLLVIPFSALIYVFFLCLNTNSAIMTALGAVAGLAGVLGVIGYLIAAWKNWGLQIYINKKPITWISLAVIIASIIVSIVIVIIEFGVI